MTGVTTALICFQVPSIQPLAVKLRSTQAPRAPAASPARAPKPISSRITRSGSTWTAPSSASAMVRKMISSGTQTPSFRPLSTLRPWRMRDGRRRW